MDTLGVVESKSIAAGAELADGMVKAAEVVLVRASPVCSGRFLVFVSGDRHAVGVSVGFARESTRALAGSFIIANISPQVLAVLKKGDAVKKGDALAVVECRTVSAGLAAADRAVKRADVRLCRLVTGQGINGKSYFVLGGDVASVEQAAQAAKDCLGRDAIEVVVLPRPEPSVVGALTCGVR